MIGKLPNIGPYIQALRKTQSHQEAKPIYEKFITSLDKKFESLRTQAQSATQIASGFNHGAPPAAPNDKTLNNSQIFFYLDKKSSKLKVRVKHSDGSLQTGEVNLT